jgi:hypothetical protein
MGLIFQYGSNCLDSEINSPERLQGEALFVGIARTADDFVLSFDVWSVRRACAAANIIAMPGRQVWGVLYEIPDYLIYRETANASGRKSLDGIEGRKYQREAISLIRDDGRKVTASTYRVIMPQTSLETSFAYVSCILEGLKERGIPMEYIDSVKEIAIANNAALAPLFEVSRSE